MGKKVLCSLILIISMLFSISANAATSVYNVATSNYENGVVTIKGCLGTTFANKSVAVYIEKNGSRLYQGEDRTDSRGYYSHNVEWNKNLSDCSAYVICNGTRSDATIINPDYQTATKLSDGDIIWVEGKIDKSFSGKTLTFLLVKKNTQLSVANLNSDNTALGHIGYASADEEGYYSYKFSFSGNVSNYKLLTKVQGSSIFNSEITVINAYTPSITLNAKNKDGGQFGLSDESEKDLTLFIKNKFGKGKVVDLISAFYDSSDQPKLIGMEINHSFSIPFEKEGALSLDELWDSIPQGTAKIKLFVWDIETLTPFGETNEYSDDTVAVKNFYVSPSGSDFNDGTISRPLKTLRGARNAVRAYKDTQGIPEDGINVYFRAGTYPVSDRVDFSDRDSGTDNSKITYSAYNNEAAIFSGGITIPGTAFTAVSDSYILNRLPSGARSKVYEVDLKEYGIYDYGTNNRYGGGDNRKIANVEVFYDDVPMVTARYPDITGGVQGYLQVASVVKEGTDESPSCFRYTDETIERATDFTDVILEGWFKTSYDYEGVEIGSINASSNTITFKEHNQRGVKENNRYCITNFLEALDHEGEYYIDRRTGMLYVYSNNISTARIGLSLYGSKLQDSFIKTDNASNITFKGLQFELSRSNGIVVTGGNSITIDGCIVRNIGLTGIIIGSDSRSGISSMMNGHNCSGTNFNNKNYIKATGHGIKNCSVYYTGEGAVEVVGGDRINLIPANHYVKNCTFHDCNRFSKTTPVVNIQGMGLELSNCDIYNSPYSAIHLGGNDIIIEKNDIHDCLKECADMGVIYSSTYMAEIQAGTEIRYNYFHDISNDAVPEFEGPNSNKIAARICIYNDYCDPFLEVHHNVFRNVPQGISNAGGAENNWKNNVFYDVYIPMKTHYNDNLSKYMNGDTSKMFYALSTSEYRMIDVDNGSWKTKYPRVSAVKAQMVSRGIKATYPSSTISDNACIFASSSTQTYGRNFISNGSNFISYVVDREYFAGSDQADYMTIQNNTYNNSSSSYDTLLSSRGINLGSIGVQ